MMGLGLLILWAGYTGFSYGNAVRKGAAVTFSDMVLPSHHDYALGVIANASGAGASKGGAKPSIGSAIDKTGAFGLSTPLVGSLANADVGIGTSIDNGLKRALGWLGL